MPPEGFLILRPWVRIPPGALTNSSEFKGKVSNRLSPFLFPNPKKSAESQHRRTKNKKGHGETVTPFANDRCLDSAKQQQTNINLSQQPIRANQNARSELSGDALPFTCARMQLSARDRASAFFDDRRGTARAGAEPVRNPLCREGFSRRQTKGWTTSVVGIQSQGGSGEKPGFIAFRTRRT